MLGEALDIQPYTVGDGGAADRKARPVNGESLILVEEEMMIVAPEFDGVFYAAQVEEILPTGRALHHFCTVGWRMGLDPCPRFSVTRYLKHNPDVCEARINPFIHYILQGRADGRICYRSLHGDGAAEMRAMEPEFDADFYLRGYPDLNGVDPLEHYYLVGWREGRDPVGWFSTRLYLAANPHVRAAEVNPFYHFISEGRRRGIPAQPPLSEGLRGEVERLRSVIDPSYYQARYPDIPTLGLDPYEHYCIAGWMEGRDPNAWFCTRKFLEARPDVAALGINPLLYWVSFPFGAAPPPVEGATASAPTAPLDRDVVAADFDAEFYRSRYPDMATTVDPLEHYCVHGWREGRDPAPWFSTMDYLARYPDIARASVNPFVHYVTVGKEEGFEAAPSRQEGSPTETEMEIAAKEFDAEFYRSRYPDMASSAVDPLEHYCVHGWREGRDPAPWFSTREYLARYPDIARAWTNPFVHYVTVGKEKGFKAAPSRQEGSSTDAEMAIVAKEFDAAYYCDAYPDIEANGLDPLAHFCVAGWKEGRNPASWFSVRLYQRRHKDVEGNPFVHYIVKGRAEKRRIWPANSDGPRELIVDPRATVVNDPAIRDLVTYPQRESRLRRTPFDAMALNIHWVIPDFSIGSGGHMTIFRFVRWLELFGHRCTIWLQNPLQHKTIESAYDDIAKHFQTVKADVRLLDKAFWRAGGDILIATSWDSVAKVGHATGFRERFYFIQDLEMSFFPRGGHSLAAEMTYSDYDLACVCASPWLEKVMRDDYGRWARHFFLAYDRTIYHPVSAGGNRRGRENGERLPRVAVYGRITTARRAVELALAALESLAARGVKFHADIYGAEMDFVEASFPCTLYGILEAEELAKLYRNAAIGICFSATNYSLVPQEMMGCGLPVIELDVPSTRGVFPEGTVTFTSPNPLTIADTIQALLENPKRRKAQAARATEWVNQFSWEKSARIAEVSFIERLRERSHPERARSKRGATFRRAQDSRISAPKASVCIPVWNGGLLFRKVIEKVLAQFAPWPFEIAVIDSSSTDHGCDFLAEYPDIKFRSIPQSDFGHGRTRNELARMCSGEFLVFITQDALPADDFWLYNMITTLEHFPDAAGGFGRHLPWPDATPYMARDLTDHFANFLKFPLAMSRDTDPERWKSGDLSWRQLLHFYSDNNSCMRRLVWEKIPYPDIEFGEDQVWARQVVEAGYQRVYVPGSSVYHSHDYSAPEWEKRTKTEALFFIREFGYEAYSFTEPFEVQLGRANLFDTKWGRLRGLPEEAIERRLAENDARLRGKRTAAEEGRAFTAAALSDGRVPDTGEPGGQTDEQCGQRSSRLTGNGTERPAVTDSTEFPRKGELKADRRPDQPHQHAAASGQVRRTGRGRMRSDEGLPLTDSYNEPDAVTDGDTHVRLSAALKERGLCQKTSRNLRSVTKASLSPV